MNTNRIWQSNSNSKNAQNSLNSQLLTEQIESLREVMRRMKAHDSSAIDSLISQKLKAAK